jgi:uncharacterized protein (DUF58 family)
MAGHVPRIRSRLSLPEARKIRGLLEGQYASSVIGRGMEFNDLREYVRGDDVKDLDWKASARSGALLVKRYVTVRQHQVELVVPTGRSMAAAHTLELSKRDVAVEVAGIVGWLAVMHGDVVGTVWGDLDRHHALRARTGELHLERCLTAVYDATSVDAAPSDLAGTLTHLAQAVRRRSIVLVVGELDEPTEELVRVMRRLAAQHQVLMVTVGDLDPVTVPARAPGAHDVDDDRSLPSWLRGDARLAADLRRHRAATVASLQSLLTGLGVAYEHLEPGTAPLAAVQRLVGRSRQARRG